MDGQPTHTARAKGRRSLQTPNDDCGKSETLLPCQPVPVTASMFGREQGSFMVIGTAIMPPGHAPATNSASATEARGRQRWTSDWSFILASVGSAIGFGNIWRFPKMCYEYGGGAFLIPYGVALFFFTIPLVILEFALGQRYQCSHVRMMVQAANRAPARSDNTIASTMSFAGGLGWSAVLGTFLLSQFYCALLAITFTYLLASFSPTLPWANGRAPTFWTQVTHPSATLEETGGLVPRLLGGYAVVYALVAAAAANESTSIELLNRIVMPVPFVVLMVFFIRGLTLEGAGDGVATLFTPDVSKLSDPDIWLAAVSQLFFGVSAGLGTLTTYASYMPREAPVVRPAILVCLGNSAFSLLAGVTVFAFLGNLAHEQGVPVTHVVTGGTSLAFEVFPNAFAALPEPNFWAVSFFLMLLNLGVSSAVSMTSPLSVAMTEALRGHRWTSADAFPKLPSLILHLFGFLTGLVYVTRAGVHWVALADHFVPLYLTVIVGLTECLVVSCRLGCGSLLADLPAPDRRYGGWWQLCWRFIIPPILSVLLVVQVVSELMTPFGAESASSPPRTGAPPSSSAASAPNDDNRDSGAVTYPAWAISIGWLLALGPTMLAPACALSGCGRRGMKRRHSQRQPRHMPPNESSTATSRGGLPREHTASIDVELRLGVS